MKNVTSTLATTAFALMLISCNNANESQQEAKNDNPTADTATVQKQGDPAFDINTIPVSDKDLGSFPFFTIPTDFEIQNKPLQRSFDRIFFPINGVMQPFEGKAWKASLVGKRDAGDSWSLALFERSYDEAIKAVGGVKIYEGRVSKTELDRIKDQATYFGEEGSLDYWNDPVKVYAIHRANGEDVYIQLAGNSASGKLQILQKEAFKQTITTIKADQIQKDLAEKGKAILYINFDTDKATLKADGRDAVAEISKALDAEKSLKISINGYTDNTGDAKHNLDLSKQRAETVKTELKAMGIDETRLATMGFGANNPIADNAQEDGKAKNRRVELVKQ